MPFWSHTFCSCLLLGCLCFTWNLPWASITEREQPLFGRSALYLKVHWKFVNKRCWDEMYHVLKTLWVATHIASSLPNERQNKCYKIAFWMFHFHTDLANTNHWSNKNQQLCLLGQWTRLCSGSDVTLKSMQTLST